MSEKRVAAEHGVVCRRPGEKFGYFGWPTVERMEDGTLAVASSGLRSEHVCPGGKTVLNVSRDDGRTWSPARVINDSPIDDRDAGVVSLGGKRLLVTWFTSDTRIYAREEWCRKWLGDEELQSWREVLDTWTDATVNDWLGSWCMRSEDAGQMWGPPIRVPVSSPHGPIRLRNGDLLYLGKAFGTWQDMLKGSIGACRSTDGGRTWSVLGNVSLFPKTVGDNYHEPHVVELPSGRLVGMIRVENGGGVDLDKDAGVVSFSIMATGSDDGGRTWSPPTPFNYHGSPPHLLRHSSGVLLLTYGYRKAPFGQRVALSRDDGATWDHDWIIRDDGPDGDLGYPSTVEMADGSLFTVCYQKVPGDKKCSLLWSRWRLPAV